MLGRFIQLVNSLDELKELCDKYNNTAFTEDTEYEESHSSDYLTSNLNHNLREYDDFTDDTIIITLTQKATFEFKDYSVGDFADIECESMRDLTKLSTATIKKHLRSA